MKKLIYILAMFILLHNMSCNEVENNTNEKSLYTDTAKENLQKTDKIKEIRKPLFVKAEHG